MAHLDGHKGAPTFIYPSQSPSRSFETARERETDRERDRQTERERERREKREERRERREKREERREKRLAAREKAARGTDRQMVRTIVFAYRNLVRKPSQEVHAALCLGLALSLPQLYRSLIRRLCVCVCLLLQDL